MHVLAALLEREREREKERKRLRDAVCWSVCLSGSPLWKGQSCHRTLDPVYIRLEQEEMSAFSNLLSDPALLSFSAEMRVVGAIPFGGEREASAALRRRIENIIPVGFLQL